ncbi:MAG: 50S ribosomal protein L25/general stress protein Ctc [Gammaproteobacteria bacterium]|nr:50S ribosomal protein L25/general stress protein Ctc [Gammaproteobacteria bacterium]MDE2251863.1 50S ribosomal protein L25/general stress protein Ctc [Gammaproteobacteria bacterium]
MRIAFELSAEPRNDQGKGASRRLRHSGMVPAILYGAHAEPVRLSLEHHKLLPLVADEKFYSSIISINVGAQKQPVIVKDVQMHPARNAVVHLDLQRVLENEKIRLHLPIHFRGEAAAPGVKTQGGVVSHHMADMEVVCLPKDLPEYIELDLSAMNLNDTLYVKDIKVPAGVAISALAHGANPPVVSIHAPRVAEPEPTAEAEAAPAEGAVAAAPAEGAAAPAADARKDEGKKDAGKDAKKEGGKK